MFDNSLFYESEIPLKTYVENETITIGEKTINAKKTHINQNITTYLAKYYYSGNYYPIFLTKIDNYIDYLNQSKNYAFLVPDGKYYLYVFNSSTEEETETTSTVSTPSTGGVSPYVKLKITSSDFEVLEKNSEIEIPFVVENIGTIPRLIKMEYETDIGEVILDFSEKVLKLREKTTGKLILAPKKTGVYTIKLFAVGYEKFAKYIKISVIEEGVKENLKTYMDVPVLYLLSPENVSGKKGEEIEFSIYVGNRGTISTNVDLQIEYSGWDKPKSIDLNIEPGQQKESKINLRIMENSLLHIYLGDIKRTVILNLINENNCFNDLMDFNYEIKEGIDRKVILNFKNRGNCSVPVFIERIEEHIDEYYFDVESLSERKFSFNVPYEKEAKFNLKIGAIEKQIYIKATKSYFPDLVFFLLIIFISWYYFSNNFKIIKKKK